MTTRQSAQEIREAIRGIESDITDREKRLARRAKALARAEDPAKVRKIEAEIADETEVLDAARENLIRHKAVLEEVETEARAAYQKRAEERRVEVEAFCERMQSRYDNGEMADRFGKIDPDIATLEIVPNGSSYVYVRMVVESIRDAGKEWERRETHRYDITVSLPEPKAMQSWYSHDRAEVNWPAYGTVDQDIARCFGQMLRVAACVGEWADTLLPSE